MPTNGPVQSVALRDPAVTENVSSDRSPVMSTDPAMTSTSSGRSGFKRTVSGTPSRVACEIQRDSPALRS
jgi:hypothetical protein